MTPVWLEIGRPERNSAEFFCRMFPKRWAYTLEENEKANFQGSEVTACKFYVPYAPDSKTQLI